MKRPRYGWISAASIEPDGTLDVVGDQRLETAIAIAQIEVVHVGLRGRAGAFKDSLEHVDVVGVGHIEGPEHERV